MHNPSTDAHTLLEEVGKAAAEVVQARRGVRGPDDNPDLPNAIDRLNAEGGHLDRLLRMLAQQQVNDVIETVRAELTKITRTSRFDRDIEEVAIGRFIEHLRVKASEATDPFHPQGRRSKGQKIDSALTQAIDLTHEQLKLSDLKQWSKRAERCFRKLGITTVNELCSYTPEQLHASKNVGKATLGEIRDCLYELGFALKEDKAA